MREFFAMFFIGLVYLLQFGGHLALAVLFFYGIYIFFAESIVLSLMMISDIMIGGWVIQIIIGLLYAAGAGLIAIVPTNAHAKEK